jgi:CBS-domain-containing membrane protein
MLHALQPAQLRRLDKHQLKALAENCEKALLAGISTNQDMLTLIEVEKELLRREKIDTRQQFLELRKTMIEQPVPVMPTPPSVTSSAVLAPAEPPFEEKAPEPIEEQGKLELLPVALNRY